MVSLFEALDLKMVLVVAIPCITEFIGGVDVGFYFLQVTLVEDVTLAGHSKLQLLAPSYGAGLNQVKLHGLIAPVH
jgi:hypothetical protein